MSEASDPAESGRTLTSAALFSRVASEYSKHRPTYPPGLYDYLASVVPSRELAWDCGTGNGQAAIELAERFERVYATDASPEQLALAPAHPRIQYAVEAAERCSLESNSVDLVSVAIAVHWFDLDRFYGEVRRVLRPGGIIAVWTYHLPRIDPGVDEVVRHYYRHVVADYWPEGFQYVSAAYRNLPFPFDELDPPHFAVDAEWDLNQLTGFLASWSATSGYVERKGHHPLDEIWADLQRSWGVPERRRRLRWPLILRVGRWPGGPADPHPSRSGGSGSGGGA